MITWASTADGPDMPCLALVLSKLANPTTLDNYPQTNVTSKVETFDDFINLVI